MFWCAVGEGVRLMLMTMDQMTAVDSHPLVGHLPQCHTKDLC